MKSEYFTSDPYAGATAAATSTVSLTGANAKYNRNGYIMLSGFGFVADDLRHG